MTLPPVALLSPSPQLLSPPLCCSRGRGMEWMPCACKQPSRKPISLCLPHKIARTASLALQQQYCFRLYYPDITSSSQQEDGSVLRVLLCTGTEGWTERAGDRVFQKSPGQGCVYTQSCADLINSAYQQAPSAEDTVKPPVLYGTGFGQTALKRRGEITIHILN